MALGMVPNDLFEEIVEDGITTFASGDLLVLFTDGVTETINRDKEEYSIDRLYAKLKGLGGKSVKAFHDDLLRELDAFAGDANEPDDVTLISARRL